MSLFIQAIFATFYLVQILLFKEKTDHFGPFPSTDEFVYIAKTGYTQPVTLFDRIRRLPPLNPYKITHQGLWEVDEKKMERWTCPTCLSFWMAGFVALFITVFIERPKSLIDLFKKLLFGLSIAGASSFLHSVGQYWRAEDGLWVRDEDDQVRTTSGE